MARRMKRVKVYVGPPPKNLLENLLEKVHVAENKSNDSLYIYISPYPFLLNIVHPQRALILEEFTFNDRYCKVNPHKPLF